METSDGRVTLTFPAGAFTTNTTVTIASAACQSLPEGFSLGSACFSITTSPETTELGANMEICVQYTSADLNAAENDPARLRLAYYDAATEQWVVLETEVDTTVETVCAETNHLSDWALIVAAKGFGLLWWHILLIALCGVIVLGGVIVLFVLPRRRPPVPGGGYEEEL